MEIKMKIIILGGFLGSGKTTIIMQMAKYMIRFSSPSSSVPVVILENEISEAGIDNQLLSQADFTVENIFSGCICCTSTASLCDSVKTIEKRYHPDWLLIEATGMAYPDNIRKVIQENTSFSAGILAIADAKRWKRVVNAMRNFVVSQLTDADVILISKIDLVSEDTLAAVRQEIQAFNTTAEISILNALEKQADSFWESIIARLNKRGDS
jgi:G3E family GTPase